ncbi:MAG: tyrosine-type recombinase/integrase [Alphaproteobacteria bacterium]|nr:tyrosine-type recombinase/integrase [Alphaproteobacteria bacterium]
MERVVRLSKRMIDAAVPADGGELWIWDAEVKGLFLRVYATGRKSFAIKYRTPQGRQRLHTIGPVGSPWTIELARKEALDVLVELTKGHDPQERRAAERGAMMVGTLIDAYLSEGPIDKPNKRGSTWVIDRSNLDRHVRPLLGQKRADAITAKDCADLQRAIAMGRTRADVKTRSRGRAIVTGGKGTAVRTMITLAAMFNWAVKRGFLAENPARNVTRLKLDRQERFLSSAEFEVLFSAIEACEQESSIHASHAAIIRLLAYTGCRKSEILGLRWSEVDADRGAINLPSVRSKTGAKRIPISSRALAIIQAQPQVSDHVFPALRDGASLHTIGLPKSWNKVRQRAGLGEFRLHDLRHSFASLAVGAGESLYVVQRALGHSKASTTERYAHLRDDPVRSMVERVGGMIDKAAAGAEE